MMEIRKLEQKLGSLYKGAPALSNSIKETLVNILPWLVLVVGVLQLFAAWRLWGLARQVGNVSNAVSALYITEGRISSTDKPFIYLGSIILLVNAVILLKAYSHLKTHKRAGWDLLFLSAVINAGYSVTQLFITGRGISMFIFNILGSVIGFYLLFQVKSKYSSSK